MDLDADTVLSEKLADYVLEAGSIRGMTSEKMRTCPTPEMNSVAWLI